MDEKQFVARLSQLRAQKGVSARDMSLSIGQNPSYINCIENGKMLPSLSCFFYICDYLNLTPMEFFNLDAANPSTINDIVQDLTQLDERQLAAVAVMVKEIARK